MARSFLKAGSLCAAFLFTACAGSYRPPEGAPVAKLVFNATTAPQTSVGLWTVPISTCPPGSKVSLLLAGQTRQKDAEVSIQAGVPFAVRAEMVSMATWSQCNVSGVFLPQPGAVYVLHHIVTPRGCGLRMLSAGSIEQSFLQLEGTSVGDACALLW